MAKRLNLRLNDIQKTEAGVQPADNILEKIAKALDISLFEENISEPERTIKTPSSRSMTIGDALDEFLAKKNEFEDVPLHVIHLGQDDPKKCSARRLSKHGHAILHKSTRATSKRGFLLDPSSGVLMGPDDMKLILLGGSIVALDCSWKRLEESLDSISKHTRLEGRTLPVLLVS